MQLEHHGMREKGSRQGDWLSKKKEGKELLFSVQATGLIITATETLLL
jgi:hypothetical protein